jgi:hypothetical protein
MRDGDLLANKKNCGPRGLGFAVAVHGVRACMGAQWAAFSDP